MPNFAGFHRAVTAAQVVALARPMVTAWDHGASIRVVRGRNIGLDGRLLRDGMWEVIAWSPGKNCQYWVTFEGDGRTETREAPPPDDSSLDMITEISLGQPGVAELWPPGWIDSPAAVAASRRYQDGTPSRVLGASFNERPARSEPGQAAWALIFDVGDGHWVSASGSYLGRD